MGALRPAAMDELVQGALGAAAMEELARGAQRGGYGGAPQERSRAAAMEELAQGVLGAATKEELARGCSARWPRRSSAGALNVSTPRASSSLAQRSGA